MRCCAPVLNERSLKHRSDRSQDPRCHAPARRRIRGRWFCRVHAPLWRTHYAILDRIRAL